MAFLILVVTPVAGVSAPRLVFRWSRRLKNSENASGIYRPRAEFFIAHSSDWLPRHFVVEFMSVGINAGTHRGEERR